MKPNTPRIRITLSDLLFFSSGEAGHINAHPLPMNDIARPIILKYLRGIRKNLSGGTYRTHRSIIFLAIIALRVCGLYGGFSLYSLTSHNGTYGGFYLLIIHSTTCSQNFLATELMVGFTPPRPLLQSNKRPRPHNLFKQQELQLRSAFLYSTSKNHTIVTEFNHARGGLKPTVFSVCPKNELTGRK